MQDTRCKIQYIKNYKKSGIVYRASCIFKKTILPAFVWVFPPLKITPLPPASPLKIRGEKGEL
jgi:hypothetical protein